MGLAARLRRPRGAPLAFVWGFAEATLFFVVPDVLLTAVAMRAGWRRAMVLAVWAALGAVLGGSVMAVWSTHDPATVRAAVTALPAISPAMFATVEEGLRGPAWPIAILAGGVGTSPIPFKVYAAVAPHAGLSLGPFLAASFGARLVRFALAATLARLVSSVLGFLALRTRLRLLLAFWVVFYALFWSLMPR